MNPASGAANRQALGRQDLYREFIEVAGNAMSTSSNTKSAPMVSIR
jgi:hypothetical protein